MYQVPILLVIYNRVFETHNLFQVIKDLQPQKLYVAADAPIEGDVQDAVNCIRTKSVIMPEWPCELHKFFPEEHQGKTAAIMNAMKWFFEQEEEGVILFEDCLPHPDFFVYCQELLERFRNDKRIYHIGAVNFRKHQKALKRKQKKYGGCSYYFSAYANTWGFATWRDRWTDFDLNPDELNQVNFDQVVKQYTRRPKERRYWHRRYNVIKKTQVPIWEYQYNFHIWLNSGLAIAPTLNLVTNVGVHTKGTKRKFRRLIKRAYPILPLKHPNDIVLDKKADKFMFKYVYSRAFVKIFTNWINDVLVAKKDEFDW